jgi:hypothetical protein
VWDLFADSEGDSCGGEDDGGNSIGGGGRGDGGGIACSGRSDTSFVSARRRPYGRCSIDGERGEGGGIAGSERTKARPYGRFVVAD